MLLHRLAMAGGHARLSVIEHARAIGLQENSGYQEIVMDVRVIPSCV